jgi:hypothetical protein
MDEVDEILLFSLRDVKCPVDELATIQSMRELSAAGVYGCAAFCVNTILASNAFPKALPKPIPVKVNLCTKLAAEIKVNKCFGKKKKKKKNHSTKKTL